MELEKIQHKIEQRYIYALFVHGNWNSLTEIDANSTWFLNCEDNGSELLMAAGHLQNPKQNTMSFADS